MSTLSESRGVAVARRVSKTSAVGTADRDWCRGVLARVSRTFAINIRLLSGSLETAVCTAYLMCRIADTIEDAWPGDAPELHRRFDQLLAALGGDVPASESLATGAVALRGVASDAHRDLVENTPRVLRCFRALESPDREAIANAVTTLAQGMRRYAVRAAERGARSAEGRAAVAPYLDTEAELGDYCWVVAGCVGSMLTELFGIRAGDLDRAALRVAHAPAVGEGLQLTNILLDWPSDVRRGRCYVPAAWLGEHGLAVTDLVADAEPVRPGVRELAERLERKALDSLGSVPAYLSTIPSRHVRFRMFCLWPALWAIASIRHARRDPSFPWGPVRPRLPRPTLRGVALAALVQGHSRAGVAGLYRSLGADPERSSTTSSTRPGSAV